MEIAWINFVHELFGRENTKAAHRQKHLLLDILRTKHPSRFRKSDWPTTGSRIYEVRFRK